MFSFFHLLSPAASFLSLFLLPPQDFLHSCQSCVAPCMQSLRFFSLLLVTSSKTKRRKLVCMSIFISSTFSAFLKKTAWCLWRFWTIFKIIILQIYYKVYWKNTTTQFPILNNTKALLGWQSCFWNDCIRALRIKKTYKVFIQEF